MLIRVGTIVRAHGVRGELKVRPESDAPNRLLELSSVVVGSSSESGREFPVDASRLQTSRHGVTVLMVLEGVDDRDSADALRGLGVYVESAHVQPLADTEWFVDDLIGMEVQDDGGSVVGRITEILDLPAHPTFVVSRADGSSVMIPAIPPFVTSVSVETRKIEVSLPDGLLDS